MKKLATSILSSPVGVFLVLISPLLILSACHQDLPKQVGDIYAGHMYLVDECTFLVYSSIVDDRNPPKPFKVYIPKPECRETFNEASAQELAKKPTKHGIVVDDPFNLNLK